MDRPTNPPFAERDRRRHNALWLLHHLTGERVTRTVAGKLRERVDRNLRDALSGREGQLVPLPEVSDIPTFLSDYLAPSRPVLFRGAAKDWPAVQEWTPDFFKERFGHEPILLLRMSPTEMADHDYSGIETTLGDALDRLHEGDRAYLRFVPVLMQHPDVMNMLDMDWFRARRGPMAPQENLHLFIGGQGTSTALHTAISANFFVQVHGRKTWKIYAPDWSWVFRPPMERSVYFSSEFDPDDPDYDAFPETRALTGYEVTLEPGDILYNPPFWWHKVTNPTVSVGVGFRFMPPKAIWSASRILTVLSALAVDPPLFFGPVVDLDFTKIFTTRPFSRR
jgi:ribosomal protein L16 Arg81 hydroxylase